ncbi:hypothetical protein [Bradyrhizobium elkanii]|uniref:hypothetical protein n=1 Tax=Bradyrhizobium elkanii TaxID=29448 RepID=UPI003517BBD6
MRGMMCGRKWGAIVRGTDATLHHWVKALDGSAGKWIERHGDDVVLRSTSFDACETAEQVFEQSVSEIEKLNSVGSFCRTSKELLFHGVAGIHSEGPIDKYIFATGVVGVGAEGFAGAIVSTVEGVSPAQVESKEQRYLKKLETDWHLRNALKYLRQARSESDIVDIWTAIYDCVDALGPYIGRGLSNRKLAAIKKRGNEFRHVHTRDKSPDERRRLRAQADIDLQSIEDTVRDILDRDDG